MNFQHNDVEKFIDILQNNITRMANSSSQCKTWCITITSALLVLILKGECSSNVVCNQKLMWMMLLPPILFWFLDSFYLHLERSFRTIYNDFIIACKKNDGDNIPDTIYQINICTSTKQTIKLMFTTSTFPFYSFQIVIFVFLILITGGN